MMNRKFGLTTALLGLCTAVLVSAAAPAPVDSIAPIPEVMIEIQSQVDGLAKAFAKEEAAFNEDRNGSIRQGFGVLAVLGQFLAEQPDKDAVKINGAALRDAALKYDRKADRAAAIATLENVKQVLAGHVEGDHATEHEWNRLINMHPMMEEINIRQSNLLRVIRRPRGREDEPTHADTWAILALAMKADTHEVKNPDDLPKWNEFADEFRTQSIELAKAIRAKDAEASRKWFDLATSTCDKCHEVFHNE